MLRITGIESADSRRELGMRLVRDLVMNDRLVPGFLTDAAGFDPWPLDPPAAVARRDHEWRQLGMDPNVSDICWFNLPNNGLSKRC